MKHDKLNFIENIFTKQRNSTIDKMVYIKIVYNVCTFYCEMRDGAAMYGFAGMFLHKNGCTAK